MKRPNKNSIGLFGGSFDPPHKGHLKIAIASIKILKLKKLYWLVTSKSPFKTKTLFSLSQRIKKSKDLVKRKKKISIRSLDKLARSTRMIKIIEYLSTKNKKAVFFLILGSDNLANFHKWQNWKKIVKLCKLLVFSRKGHDNKAKKSFIFRYLNQKNIIFVKNYKIDISSSKLRKNLLS